MGSTGARGVDGSLSGWARVLPEMLSGPHDADRALREVAEAIRHEQRVAARPVDLRVDAAERMPGEDTAESQLWDLRCTLSEKARGLRDWQGARLIRDLAEKGQPWTAEVLDADPARGRFVVVVDPETRPQVGPARVLPFDFLRAARDLVESPRLLPARPVFARLLGATVGSLKPSTALAGAHLHTLKGAPSNPAWAWPWEMVWGPPGTGKTHTLVDEVQRIVQEPDERVLVVSTTNKATDEVALRLGQQAGGVLRVGTVDVSKYRKEGRLDLLPRPVQQLEAVERAQAQLSRARTWRQRANALLALSRARRGVPRLRDLLAEQAPRCVLTTAHGALSAVTSPELEPFLAHRRAPFTTVIIDEAGLIPRATVAALGLLAARQVVLVGDPMQLSPICVAARSMAPSVKRWLALSAMERVSQHHPWVQPLHHQYRMHPDICATVSLFQYGGRLQDAYKIRSRPLPEPMQGRLAAWPRAAWVVLDQCEGLDLTSIAAERGSRRSWKRPAGIEIFDRLLGRYPKLGELSGLFISPYRAQAHAAEAVLEHRGLAEHWTASTVHRQQGAQADVVVFDLVRHGGWPLPEWKRLVNVALSRARHQLVVLAGHSELHGQAGCSGLVEQLRRCRVSAQGSLQVDGPEGAQQSLLQGMSTTIDGPAAAPRPAAVRPRRSAPSQDPADLGTQIFHSRAARRAMTRTQAQLVRRDLKDLGPRVVRGVAGSGKTIVLARWAAVELHRYPDRDATVVFGNTALRGHLARLLEQAWRVTVDDATAEPPWNRIHFKHMGELIRDLQREADLPPPDRRGKYDYEAQAKALRAERLPARFGLLYLDEAQDLGHETLALLFSLVVPSANAEAPGQPHLPVRIFYDNAQNVYRRSTPRWSEFKLAVRGRSVVLRESFRATRPAMELALDVVHALRPLDQDPDLRELIAPRSGPPLLVRTEDGHWRADFCVVQGQAPDVSVHPSPEDEVKALVGRIQGWLAQGVAPRDIRVLSPRKRRCEQITVALEAAGVPVICLRNTRFDNRDPRVVVTTPHSFKGHEAELIAVVGAEEFVAPGEDGPQVLVEALYVALTRARTWMVVSAVRGREGEAGARIVAALEGAVRRG